MNRVFFSTREIYVRLTSVYRNIMTEYSPFTIMRWCSEVIADFIKDPCGSLPYTAMLGRPTANKTCALPSDIFKLDRVYDIDSGKDVDYVNHGAYLLFGDDDLHHSIAIDYHRLLLDDDGFPLIPRGYEKACEAYCEYQIFKPRFMEGSINANQWREISDTKDWEIEAASRSWDNLNSQSIKDVQRSMVNPAYKAFKK